MGQEFPFPILLAPTGGQKLIHPEGGLAAVRGAAAANATYVISSNASLRVEDIARAATGPVWFQLYVQRDRGFTRDLVQRAEDSGCRALCVTVDSPTFGARNREDRAKGELPEAAAVQIGRPYLWGLGMAGAEGVTRVVQILRKEFEMAMALMGRPTISSVDRTVLW